MADPAPDLDSDSDPLCLPKPMTMPTTSPTVSIHPVCMAASMDGRVECWGTRAVKARAIDRGNTLFQLVRLGGADIGKADGFAQVLCAGTSVLNPPLPNSVSLQCSAEDGEGLEAATALVSAGDGTAVEFAVSILKVASDDASETVSRDVPDMGPCVDKDDTSKLNYQEAAAQKTDGAPSCVPCAPCAP